MKKLNNKTAENIIWATFLMAACICMWMISAIIEGK